MHFEKAFVAAVSGAALFALVSCTSVGISSVPTRGNGPPAHAPAHGRRAKATHAQDVRLVFDAGLGVYVVVDVPDTYYLDGVYIRLGEGGWLVSAALEGPWDPHPEATLPPGLRKKYGKKPKKSGHPGRGRGAAKGAW